MQNNKNNLRCIVSVKKLKMLTGKIVKQNKICQSILSDNHCKLINTRRKCVSMILE